MHAGHHNRGTTVKKQEHVYKLTSTLPHPVARFVAICVGLELLVFAGQVLAPGIGVRQVVVVLGGFWPDALGSNVQVYPGQAVFMFASSAFLHGGPLHLLMNMIGLVWLAPIVIERVGDRSFWPIAGLSALGAGTAFVVLTTSNVPMVGASGVLFGLLGTVSWWSVADRVDRRESLGPVIGNALGFLVLNITLMALSPGTIAWQAHLGGFLAGLFVGAMTWKRQRGVLVR